MLEDDQLLGSGGNDIPNTEAKTLSKTDKNRKGDHPNKVNLFLGIQLRISVTPATKSDLEGVKFYMQATAFHDTSYRAAIYLYVVALDKLGRPFVYPFAPNLEGGLDYSPEHVVSCELGFNHKITQGGQNEIIDNRYGPGIRKDLQVATDCIINDPSKIDELEIPKKPQTRLAYWQASQMVGQKSLMLPGQNDQNLIESD